MQEIFAKQEILMDTVPHPLTPRAAAMSIDAIHLIEAIILLINSHGRKPWRPEPLSIEKRKECQDHFGCMIDNFNAAVNLQMDYYSSEGLNRQMVSVLGIIEEAVECFNDIFLNKDKEYDKKDRAKILEEYVDIHFFWTELGLENEFTWQEIKQEYMRKWAVNMKRYADSKAGDISWDDRKDKTSL